MGGNMNIRILVGVMTITLAAIAPGTLYGQNQQQEPLPHYKIVNLGMPLGGTSSGGNSINDLAWISGSANLAGNTAQHAYLWANGFKADLGTFGGPNSLVSFPVKNNRGDIVGYAENPTTDPLGENFCQFGTGLECRAFLWRAGQLIQLPTLGGNNGRAAGENNLGQIVGWTENNVEDSTCVHPVQFLQFEAVIWGPGKDQIQQLPPLPGDSDTAAVAINDKGQAVGISGQCDIAFGELSAEHSVLWENGQAIQLPTLGGVAWNTPDAINNHGEVVGFSDLPGDSPANPNFHAFLWTSSSGITDLGTLPQDGPNAVSEATSVNERGQIVGQSCATGFANCHAVLWQNGRIVDMNTLIPAGSPFQLLYAGDINDSGEITGQACVLIDGACTSNSATPAFLAIPTTDWDDNEASSSAARSQSKELPKASLPANVRRQMMQRLGLIRPGSSGSPQP
jgi:probable HAF family extracellular repeat protein